jgi:hypothetical protein
VCVPHTCSVVLPVTFYCFLSIVLTLCGQGRAHPVLTSGYRVMKALSWGSLTTRQVVNEVKPGRAALAGVQVAPIWAVGQK